MSFDDEEHDAYVDGVLAGLQAGLPNKPSPQALKWSEVIRWMEKWGIEVENKAFDELKEIIDE